MAAGAGSRRVFVGGNWKAAATMDVVRSQMKALNDMEDFPDNVDVWLAPSGIHLEPLRQGLRKEVHLSTQNIHWKGGLGAFTGEVTAAQVTDLGLGWVMVGHSERRSIFGEEDSILGTKVEVALDAGLQVVFCLGEHLEDREGGRTLGVIEAQLEVLAKAVPEGKWGSVVVAYEPVWAIGTGKTASPEQAQEAHAALRAWLAKHVSADVAAATRIIYGGSVKRANCEAILAQPDIDGFLIGGASLKPEFADIIRAAAAADK